MRSSSSRPGDPRPAAFRQHTVVTQRPGAAVPPDYTSPNVRPAAGEDLPPRPAGGGNVPFVEPDGRLLRLEYHLGEWEHEVGPRRSPRHARRSGRCRDRRPSGRSASHQGWRWGVNAAARMAHTIDPRSRNTWPRRRERHPHRPRPPTALGDSWRLGFLREHASPPRPRPRDRCPRKPASDHGGGREIRLHGRGHSRPSPRTWASCSGMLAG